MHHSEIEDAQFTERFMLDRLSDEEREMFAAHLIDCSQCQDAVRAAGALARGLKSVRQEFLVREGFPARVPVWSRPIELWQGIAMAAACLVLAMIPGVVWQRQLAESRATQANALAGAENQRRAAELARADLARGPGAQAMPVYPLEIARGAASEQVPEIAIPAAGGVVLAIPRDVARQASAAELQDTGGHALWIVSPLPNGAADALGLTAPRRLLAPGQYALVLRAGDRVIARFPFRAVAAQ
jgi:hypothetical protein